ncbi:MAG: xanthine dehydrogenase family protein molybdopterin-binding subunit, partial [Ornithinimicrobium sp.]
ASIGEREHDDLMGSWPGESTLRVEDHELLRGGRNYTDDVPSPDALHAVFVRSLYPHARICSIDASAALLMPAVVVVFTADDLPLATLDPGAGAEAMRRPPIAADVVRFVGEIVAVVVASTRSAAVDAAELVDVTYDPMDCVIDPAQALSDASPTLFAESENGNLAARGSAGNCDGSALIGAEVIVRGRFVNQRVAPVPMEPAAGLAAPDSEDQESFVLWTPTQMPHPHRDAIAECLGLNAEALRLIAPAIGGGFGARLTLYPETVLLVALAQRLQCAVRFVESRSESMASMTHARGQVQQVALAGTRDGRVTGLETSVIADAGAYPAGAAHLPSLTSLMGCGVYDIANVDFRYQVAVTNTTPVGAYRGAGRPEATALLERAMDLYATEIGIDPAEVRRRNFISAQPHTTPTGADYDSGDYAAALDTVLEAANYSALRVEQAARRARGETFQLGIGLCSYVEWTGFGSEHAACEIGNDGVATVLSGTCSNGQGHETAYAQLVCGLLGVAMDSVRVIQADTARVARGLGTGGSRSLQIGGSAVSSAASAVLAQAKDLAARELEADVQDICVYPGTGLGVIGAPGTAIPWSRLARAAGGSQLRAESDYTAEGSTYPFGAHLSVVEVDIETGAPRLLRHVTVDDAGTIINPRLFEGQVHGGIAQGLGQALFEEVVFDEAGTNITGSLASYVLPGSRDLPHFDTHRTQTPTPRNTLGAKGIGEAGTTGATAAAWNAVVDAVSYLGVRNIDMPTTPQRVWEAISEAKKSARGSPAELAARV